MPQRGVYPFEAAMGRQYTFSLTPLLDDKGKPVAPASRSEFPRDLQAIKYMLWDMAHHPREPLATLRLKDLWRDTRLGISSRPISLHTVISELAERIAGGRIHVYMTADRLREAHQRVMRAAASNPPPATTPRHTNNDTRASLTGKRSSPPAPATPAESPQVPSLPARRGKPPKTLQEAQQRLQSMAELIKRNGYQPKYSDAELEAQVRQGNVPNERFQVRFSESDFAAPEYALGTQMDTPKGKVVKYWATSFDQIEDSDEDASLICPKLGLDYDPAKSYTLVIIDMDKAGPAAGIASILANFDGLGGFLNQEIPDEFPKGFTDEVMNDAFQAMYAEEYATAEHSRLMKDGVTAKKFDKYLRTRGFSKKERGLLRSRFDMHQKIGANQHYTGDGLTKNLIPHSSNKHGAVETFNVERKIFNRGELQAKGVISTPIQMDPKP